MTRRRTCLSCGSTDLNATVTGPDPDEPGRTIVEVACGSCGYVLGSYAGSHRPLPTAEA